MTNDFFFCMLTYHLNFSSLIDLATMASQKLNYHNYTMHYILYVLEIDMHICLIEFWSFDKKIPG